MKKLSTYLLIFFAIMYWGFRVVLALTNSIGIDMGIAIPNITIEIVLLFVTLLSIVLLIKRKMIGALLYLLSYGAYLVPAMISNVQDIINSHAGMGTYTNLFVSAIGIILPLCVLLDLLFDRNRKAHPKDKKTDWFYTNQEFDRKIDERADKNNYHTM